MIGTSPVLIRVLIRTRPVQGLSARGPCGTVWCMGDCLMHGGGTCSRTTFSSGGSSGAVCSPSTAPEAPLPWAEPESSVCRRTGRHWHPPFVRPRAQGLRQRHSRNCTCCTCTGTDRARQATCMDSATQGVQSTVARWGGHRASGGRTFSESGMTAPPAMGRAPP